MTNKQILKQAIEKAVKNGFSFPQWEEDGLTASYLLKSQMYQWIIFNHDFAKAFWKKGTGEKAIAGIKTVYSDISWKVCLREMVLEEEPLLYIEKLLT